MASSAFNKTCKFVWDNPIASASVAVAGLATGAVIAPGVVAGGVLTTLGFAADGIVKGEVFWGFFFTFIFDESLSLETDRTGSLAAAWQSSIGSVVAPSLFATLQSAGAMGYGAAAVAGATAKAGTVAAAAAGVAGAAAYPKQQ